ncbi:MAG: hypothetical protein ACR2GG_04965, partial [Gemmatimonadaceae bacterium]
RAQRFAREPHRAKARRDDYDRLHNGPKIEGADATFTPSIYRDTRAGANRHPNAAALPGEASQSDFPGGRWCDLKRQILWGSIAGAPSVQVLDQLVHIRTVGAPVSKTTQPFSRTSERGIVSFGMTRSSRPVDVSYRAKEIAIP